MDALKLALEAARERDAKRLELTQAQQALLEAERQRRTKLIDTMLGVLRQFHGVNGITLERVWGRSAELHKDGGAILTAEVGLHTYFKDGLREEESMINIGFLRPGDIATKPSETGHYSNSEFLTVFPKRFGELYL